MFTTAEPVAERKLLATDLPDTDGLSDLQRAIVTAYLQTGNKTKAGRMVGLKYPSVQGPRMLENVAVRRAIKRELENRRIDESQVLTELSMLAYANMADFMDEYGAISPEAVRKNGHLVKKYKVTERQHEDGSQIIKTEIELHDRHQALVDVGKKYRMFGSDTQVNVQVNIIADLQREMGPLLTECLDPAKIERFAQGMAALALKHGYQAPRVEMTVSTMQTLPPMAEVRTDAVASHPEAQELPKQDSNGENGNGQHEIGT